MGSEVSRQMTIEGWHSLIIVEEKGLKDFPEVLRDETSNFYHNQYLVQFQVKVLQSEQYQFQIIVVKNSQQENQQMSNYQKYLQSLTTAKLKAKYATGPSRKIQSCGLIYQHVINCIVHPKHFLNHYRIEFEENQINCNQKQFLKRYYVRQQYHTKCSALTQYYKFHQNYPVHQDPTISIILMNFQQARNKQQRKFIKRIMNEPESASSCLNSSAQSTTRREFKDQKINNQFSLKLRDLDLNRSSLMLQQICLTIDEALNDVKPLYFYRGTYKDGVKDFKRFINFKLDSRKAYRPQKLLFSKKRCDDDNFIKKEKQINFENEPNKQNESKNNKNELLHKSKFDSNRRFKKNFNIVPSQALHRVQKKQNFSRLTRNKTTTIKPQSFSKTTANQTVSRDEYHDEFIKKRNKSTVRIRKCKSVMKNFSLQKTKSSSKLKMPEPEIKNRQKSHRMLSTMSQSRPNSQIKRQDLLSKTKKQVKKSEHNGNFERVLTRQQSKSAMLKEGVKENGLLEIKRKQNTLQTLIKAKLNLRG